MAWLKEIEREDTGAKATYWDVMSLYYLKKTGETRLIVGGWVSKDAKDAGKDPLSSEEIVIPSGTSPDLAAGVNVFGENYARSLPQFSGATDA